MNILTLKPDVMKEKITLFIQELNQKFPKSHEALHEGFMCVPGRKYSKICRERDGVPVSAYGFIDNINGNLFKSASYNAPAKHARGTILDSTALAACGPYSVSYLR